MLTYQELREIISSVPKEKINSHVHTHLCDGRPDMTVANIAAKAEERGVELVILTPHFHKQVTDGVTTLYEDSKEEIFVQLREEITAYEQSGGKVRFLLSTEADILSVDGTAVLPQSERVLRSLDLVTPTVNYHPLLLLEAVAVTHNREIDDYHESGRYGELEELAGGHGVIVEAVYEAEANAIRKCPYPAMVGHFFCCHTIPRRKYSWFAFEEADQEIMYKGLEKLLAVCVEKSAMFDLTGIHFAPGVDEAEQQRKDGFLYEFQKYTMDRCRELGIPYAAGTDAHGLGGV